MGILITRLGVRGKTLTTMCNQAGLAAIHLPFFNLEKGSELNLLPQKLQSLSAGDYVLAVSHYAVSYASSVLQNVGFEWRQDLHYFAVGRKTAAEFSEITEQTVVYPALVENSEGILALPQFSSPNLTGKKLLLLRGNSGRELLQNTIPQRGGEVELLTCYHRTPLKQQVDPFLFCRAGIDTIIVSSGEILTALLDFIPKNEHNWLFSCRLIVISQRLADLAIQAGWQIENIVVTDKADNNTLFQTVLSFSYS
ncbi:uroporphyrinogen-III synthase [Mergibacter septicus]|uniref:uroporphyrinogen-III synthase n=1 Tax=Mergibacter septicus TaxID=221402 RepID=UPI001178F253|nr:uroporphyrinogen-III synthase [Mergibacter septicus]AWX14090.1 uroporphyrinogen-III synthase [Mergibacter septicus]